MLTVFSVILLVVLFARLLEHHAKIPFALSAVVLAYTANGVFNLSLLGRHFQELLFLMLPIILIPDLLKISRHELKENMGAIIYLAFFGVLFSVAISTGILSFFFQDSSITLIMIGALLIPLSATDVVLVSSVVSRFKLPERLKVIAEGESLFNDITAMVLFFFIMMPLLEGESVGFEKASTVMVSTFLYSLLIGAVVGFVGYLLFKLFHDRFEQFLLLYITASLSFLAAEHLHVSGILSVVAALMLFKLLIDKEGHYKEKKSSLFKLLNKESTSGSAFRAYKKEAYYLGLFANGVIFIAIANSVDTDLLLRYKDEIIAVFLVTTVVRFVMVYAMTYYYKLPFRWATVLTLAGMRGGLAIIMVYSLPESFSYKEMFLAVTVGVVILSMFVYTVVLILSLRLNQDAFRLDKVNEGHDDGKQALVVEKKNTITGAYSEIIFEDFIEKEIDRANRYNYSFAIVAFHMESSHAVKEKIVPTIRQSDMFGKVAEDTYAILATHCGIEGAVIVANRINTLLECHVAVSEYSTGDTVEMMMEKLHTALESKKKIDLEI